MRSARTSLLVTALLVAAGARGVGAQEPAGGGAPGAGGGAPGAGGGEAGEGGGAPGAGGGDAALAEAGALYDEGRAAFDLAEYDRAIEAFRASYRLSREPDLLFNLAQSYRLKGDCVEAARFYRSYRRLAPDAPGAAVAERHLPDMDRCAAEQDAERRRREAAREERARAHAAVAGAGPGGEAAPRGRDRGRARRIAGVATVAVGVGLLGLAAYEGLQAQDAADRMAALLVEGGAWDEGREARYRLLDDERGRARSLAIAGGVSGAVVVAGGGVLTYLGARAGADRAPPPVTLVPLPRGGALVVLTFTP